MWPFTIEDFRLSDFHPIPGVIDVNSMNSGQTTQTPVDEIESLMCSIHEGCPPTMHHTESIKPDPCIWKIAIEIVGFSIEHDGSFHRFVNVSISRFDSIVSIDTVCIFNGLT